MSIIDLKSKSKNLFSDLIKEVITYGSSDEIMHDLTMPELLNLPQEKKDLIGANGRKKVMKKFSLSEMLDKTLEVYEELIERRQNINN